MEALKENLEEAEIGSSVESFQKFLDSQKDLFHSQIDHLQNIVVTQCKLTGVNPLSQEMAAGALSVKIGKRPRDLLNPKAVKYMQALFSIKDAVSKKECRQISAQFGVTVTQVREFFASQRSRVRRLVRVSREKATRANSHKTPEDDVLMSSSPMIPIEPVPLNTVGPDMNSFDSVAQNLSLLNSIDPVPLSTVGISSAPISSVGSSSTEEAPSCSTQGDVLPGLDDSERHFVQNVFGLLRKEETFSGQVKLMEWILRIQNPSVLNWFLSNGGVMILTTWLSQAAAEEQTSFLSVILNVLCHLPLQKAFPEHMSAILHSVNRLRFYRTTDISNRARVLLSKWSKMFARSQVMKKPNGMKSSTDAQTMILKKSIDDIMGKEWDPSLDIPEDLLALPSESSENARKTESQPLKLLPAPADDPSKKHILGVSSSYARERRKVQLVEQPGQKIAGRSPQATKTAPITQGRPMSADDIQKAKLRALYMQGKFPKTASSSNGSNSLKTGGLDKPSTMISKNGSPISKVPARNKIEEPNKPVINPPKINKSEGTSDPKEKMDTKEPLCELSNRFQISWQTPPEIKLNHLWSVGTGENSKEVDVQKNRNRREMETIYRSIQDIPFNPKEPWDIEMDYDDSLTPEIPIEQPADATDGAEAQVSHSEHVNTVVAAAAPPQIASGNAAEPDFELLAVLLKNPELVFALTSGQAGNLSIQETVKLLDVIKNGGTGTGISSSVNGFVGKVEEKVEVSLPSPTPSSNPGTSGWRPDAAKNPFSQQTSMESRVAYADPGVATTIRSTERLTTSMLRSQNQTTNIRMVQQQPAISFLSQQVPFSLPQTGMPDTRRPSPVPSNSLMLQQPASEMALRNVPSHSIPEFSAASGPSMRIEAINNNQAAPSTSYAMNTLERRPAPFSLPQAQSTRLQPQLQPYATEQPPVAYTSRQPQMTEPWRSRQGLAPNSISQVNQNNYDASYGTSLQSRVSSGPPWDRNVHVRNDGFESWSPENSPGGSPGYMGGRNYSGPRLNPGYEYVPDNRPRQRNPSAYPRDYNRDGNRRWR